MTLFFVLRSGSRPPMWCEAAITTRKERVQRRHRSVRGKVREELTGWLSAAFFCSDFHLPIMGAQFVPTLLQPSKNTPIAVWRPGRLGSVPQGPDVGMDCDFVISSDADMMRFGPCSRWRDVPTGRASLYIGPTTTSMHRYLRLLQSSS